MNTQRFLRFRHAAIKRYGERNWAATSGYIEFNPNYTVSLSKCEIGEFGDSRDTAYIVELSNGTKFLCFMRDYGNMPEDEMLSSKGEEANGKAAEIHYETVKYQIYKLNGGKKYAK